MKSKFLNFLNLRKNSLEPELTSRGQDKGSEKVSPQKLWNEAKPIVLHIRISVFKQLKLKS